jgi:translation initiation factor 4A
VLEQSALFMRDDRLQILVPKDEMSHKRLKQYYVKFECDSDFQHKSSTLQDLYTKTDSQTIVFVNSKSRVDKISADLVNAKIGFAAIHGDTSKEIRDAQLRMFTSNAVKLLICTDVLGKGIDIPSISLVINFDLPFGEDFKDVYYQRIGRTCRGARNGSAISFLSSADDSRRLEEIITYFDNPIKQLADDFVG